MEGDSTLPGAQERSAKRERNNIAENGQLISEQYLGPTISAHAPELPESHFVA